VDDIASLVKQAVSEHVGLSDRLVAFGRIVLRYQDMAYGYAYAILGDFQLVQDAAQEAFLAAYQKLPGLREPAAFAGWLRRIVATQCNRMQRRRLVTIESLDAASTLPATESQPLETFATRQMTEAVLAAIRSLSESQRTATTLFYINGYSQKDIAQFLEVPVTTVKKRLATSRRRLRERMTSMVEETLKSFSLPDRFADVLVQMKFVSERIDPLAERMQALSEDQMHRKTAELRKRLAEGENRDSIKAEAFALVREASRRSQGLSQYDVQFVAGMMLDQGWVVEAATGEGKALVCVAPAYMAVLDGLHVDVVTVNDYLAMRDAQLARSILAMLDVTVGHIVSDMPVAGGEADERRCAYERDITYGTAAQFGFDHLRVRMHGAKQRALDFAIIDEIDSVLIDERATPLIIGRTEGNTASYRHADAIVRKLVDRPKCYEAEPATLSVRLTQKGLAALPGSDDTVPRHLIEQSLRAHLMYQRDEQYIVDSGQVVILDESIGRPMHGRQWSDGLHQAVEAKEGVDITEEAAPRASIRSEQYFKLYGKLAGVTGTAATSRDEFLKAYHMQVAAVPTRRPANRVDHVDVLCRDSEARRQAVAEEASRYSRDLGRPVLVGTTSIDQSEAISKLLTERQVAHRVLDARPEKAAHESQIIADAGSRIPLGDGSGRSVGAVTVATTMAGRGTDVQLGDDVVNGACRVPSAETLMELGVESDELFPPGAVKCCIACSDYDAATGCARCFKPKLDAEFPHRGRSACRRQPPCGLHVIGAGRHEARRIDDQLRARAGRQGDPGSSRFFVALDDSLVAAVADDIAAIAGPGLAGRTPLEDRRIANAIECAQERIEQHNADIRHQCSIHREE